MPAKKKLISEQKQFHQNKKIKINTTESRSVNPFLCPEDKDVADNSSEAVEHWLAEIDWEADYSSLGLVDDGDGSCPDVEKDNEGWMLLTLAEEKEFTLGGSAEKSGDWANNLSGEKEYKCPAYSPLLQNSFLNNSFRDLEKIKVKAGDEAVSKSLWLLKLECLLEEKVRLIEWIADENNHNDALVINIHTCIKNFKEFLEDPLLDTHYRIYKNDLIEGLLQLSSASLKLPPSVPSSDKKHITYLIPCFEDLLSMASLCAGAEESQMQRLIYISYILKEELGNAPLFETGTSVTQNALDRLPWQLVFKAIKLNNKKVVKAAFENIPKDDLLFKALLEVHSYEYLLNLAVQCAKLKINEDKVIHTDVVCSHLTFELLIRDLISTVEQRRALNFSIGLPTHHAYQEHPAGFCIINKVAVLFIYEQSTTNYPLEAFCLGFDVNRDDGLNEITMKLSADYSITHIDIHDSRVYPWHDASKIDKMLGMEHERQDSMNIWQKQNKSYKTIDLAENPRNNSAHHPALMIALKELELSLTNAQKTGKKLIIFLPTGWDSHCEEQAHCGRMISHIRLLGKKESEQCRFTDEDIKYFNHELKQLHHQYEANIHRMYWQLEGGYTAEVNKRQIVNLVAEFKPQCEFEPSIGLGL